VHTGRPVELRKGALLPFLISADAELMLLRFGRGVLFRKSQKLEPLLGHLQPSLLFDRVRCLFCAFSGVFEVGSVSYDVKSHSPQ